MPTEHRVPFARRYCSYYHGTIARNQFNFEDKNPVQEE
jgi:hypothetical protein